METHFNGIELTLEIESYFAQTMLKKERGTRLNLAHHILLEQKLLLLCENKILNQKESKSNSFHVL